MRYVYIQDHRNVYRNYHRRVEQRTQCKTIIVIFLTLSVVACQTPPTSQLTLAEKSLTAAKEAEAATYASDELTAADGALRAVLAEFKVQEAKLALFRDYALASRLITEAQSKADAATLAAVAGKEQARNEAEASLAAAENAFMEAEAMIAELAGCTPYPRGFSADLALTQTRVDSLGSGTRAIQDAIQAEQYLDALTQAEAFLSQIQPLLDDMTSAENKLRCRETEDYPMFPWPPPWTSAKEPIPAEYFRFGSDSSTLADIDRKLSRALETKGYFESSYFAIPEGFALVTKLE